MTRPVCPIDGFTTGLIWVSPSRMRPHIGQSGGEGGLTGWYCLSTTQSRRFVHAASAELFINSKAEDAIRAVAKAKRNIEGSCWIVDPSRIGAPPKLHCGAVH